jgi:hypothetical protein
MKIHLIFILLLMTILGCYAQKEITQRISYSIDEVTGLDPESVVQITMTISGEIISDSSPVEVRISIQNLTDRRIFYGRGSSSCRCHLSIVDGEKEYSAYIPRVCTADHSPYYLGPGEYLPCVLKWTGEVTDRDTRSRKRIAPGSYEMVGRAGSFESAPVAFTIVAE